MTLYAHTNTRRVSEAEVMAVPEPAFTPTWHPVSHSQVIHAMYTAAADLGIRTVNREYSLNKSGTRMFGSWALEIAGNGIGYELGVRNSIDKSMVIGICAGTRVFVCDNLAFSSEYIAFRRHTKGVDADELISISTTAISQAVVHMGRMVEWQKSLRGEYVPREGLKALTFDLMKADVFSPSNFHQFLAALDEERRIPHSGVLSGATTLATVHGAATRIMRGWNLLRVSESTARLEHVIRGYLEHNPLDA